MYQDLSTRHNWPVKKGNSKRTSGNSLSPLGAGGGGGSGQNKDLSAALPTLLTEVKFYLQRRLFKPIGEISVLT